MQVRFECQGRLPSLAPAPGILNVPGFILYEVDGSLGLRYFLIDKRLFDIVPEPR
jgi:hypothetical protein